MITGSVRDVSKLNMQCQAIDNLDFVARKFADTNGKSVQWDSNSLEWYLVNTKFSIMIPRYGVEAGKIYWKEMIDSTGFRYYVSFEKVLNSVPLDIQTKLLFNIDLFK